METSIVPQARYDRQLKYFRNGVYKYEHPNLFYPVYFKMFWK